MPNWVYNTLSVTGPNVNAVSNELAAPYLVPVDYNYYFEELEEHIEFTLTSGHIFSFMNCIAPAREGLEEYYGTYGSKNGVRYGGGSNNWYRWNLENWGTKWDANDAELLETDNDDEVLYKFDTAWSPPLRAIKALSMKFPDNYFSLEYEEEQGWGGRIEYKDGDIEVLDEYDIPSSHADFNQLAHRECECKVVEEPEYWFKDCPVDTEKYEWNTDEGYWKEKESNE